MSVLNFKGIPEGEILFKIIEQLDGFALADEEGRYVFVNKQWEDLTGYKLEDVRGLYVHDIMPETRFDLVLKTGRTYSGEMMRSRSRSGEELSVLCTYCPIIVGEKIVGAFVVTSFKSMAEMMTFSGQLQSLLHERNYYQRELEDIQGAKYSISNIIGHSEPILHLKNDIYTAARSASTVIIQGETGTGKELVAHSIHALSPRAHRPFIKINCAAIPADLLESELFGYAAGAFTGASRQGKKGKFQLANKGTLFLDEINQLPLQLQPKLLRALQEREVEPVGGAESVPVDCRIIAASNVSLEQMVADGTFREDLFYRLNVMNLDVPPLRERKEDIPEIADALVERLNAQLGMAVPGISAEAKERLKDYNWPGNVRELQNVVERAMNAAWMDTLTWSHFEGYFENRRRSAPQPSQSGTGSIRSAREEAERESVRRALESSGGNKTAAAEALGITRAMLYRKMKKYGIE